MNTGKSVSEALILESVNPQYDEKRRRKIQVDNMCTKIVFCFDIQNNTISMNNLSSYCGLTDSRMRASDTDLLVLISKS